jgi:hypothetical protein
MSSQFTDHAELGQKAGLEQQVARGQQAGLGQQAGVARSLGSAFVASVLEAGQNQLWRAPRTAALIADWPGDPAAAAMSMRFNAALHAIARRGHFPALNELYRRRHGDFEKVIGEVLGAEDDFIAEWMRHTPQTNEVGRAAAIWAALMVARREIGQWNTSMPFELLELGSSCGLNLNLAHYGYDLGGILAGTLDSAVRVAPRWRGSPPPFARVELTATRGVDLHPLDPGDAATRERLMAFVWADEPERAERLHQALVLAQMHPPRIDRANAAVWLAARLREPQPEGVCRVVFHSMVMQYLEPQDRGAVTAALAEAGAQASQARPLARISFEWTVDRNMVELTLTMWPDGTTRRLASCHPYGQWIDWQPAPAHAG